MIQTKIYSPNLQVSADQIEMKIQSFVIFIKSDTIFKILTSNYLSYNVLALVQITFLIYSNLMETKQKNQLQINQDYDAVFIRHAESHFNQGTMTYVQQYELYDLTWLDLVQNQEFNNQVTYNPIFIDPHITQKGVKQCKHAKQQFDPEQVDLIFVSPQKRALQTCRQIFGNHKKVIVHPLVTEVFRYSCDVSQLMDDKIQQFKHYNFEEMKNWSEEWFLEVLSEKKQKICKQYFEKHGIKDFKDRQIAVVKLLSEGIIAQSPQQLRQRVGKLKLLIRDLKKVHNAGKIAVVSHHYTTQCLLSPGFSENGEVKGIGTIQNGKPYLRKFQDILSVQ